MKNMYRRGDNMLPCGTPANSGTCLDILDQTVILYINKEELGSSTPCVYTLERKHMKANAKKSRNLFPDKDI